jgi:arylsulfatase A
VRPPSTTWAAFGQPSSLRLLVRAATVVLLGLAGPLQVNAAPSTPTTPNILFILADDLGYGDLSYQNPSSKIQTPRLDALASQGMCFSSAHAPSGLCTPSRYSLMCGQFCWRSRLKSGVLNAWDEPIIPRERVTVASMLRGQGYATGCFGKWHLGMSWPFVGVIPTGFDTTVKASDINWNRRISGGPIDHGFDYFFGINIANEAPYAYVLNDHVMGLPTAQYDTATGLQSHWAGPGVPGWDWSRVLPDVVSNAVDWLQQSVWQTPARPFFLYLALPGPHQPVVPTSRFEGTSQAGLYGDYVQ